MQFNEMNLMPEILRAIDDIGFTEATDIQSGAIPLLLEGRDLIGRSSTGTGKTAAFGIPVLQAVAQSNGARSQVLILSPTRELAIQTSEEFGKFSKYLQNIKSATVCGGQSMPAQIRQLRTAQIIIGTPGRVMDHLRRRTMSLENLETVILDEADEMLNMGFLDDIRTILNQAPEARQTVLFSATMPPAIMEITKQFQTNPEMIAVDKGQKTVEGISQFYYRVKQQDKTDALKLLLEFHKPKRAMVFCNTKKMVDELCAELSDSGFLAVGIHGDLKQNQRNQVMSDFKSGRSNVLIATDVAARGIDVEDIDAVFNFDIPQENEYYIHRIGRTGRAGKTGSSHTLAANRTQVERVHMLERFMGTKIKEAFVPNVEEIEKRHQKKFIAGVRKMVDADNGSEWLPFIKTLEQEGYSANRIAAALCAVVSEKGVKPSSLKNISKAEPAPAEKNTVRLSLNIGSNQKIKADFIIGAIVEATGLPVSAVRDIDIHSEHSVVEMEPHDAELVLHKMSEYKIKQRSVRFTPVSEKKSEHGFSKQDRNYANGYKKGGGKNYRGGKSGYRPYSGKKRSK